jgi:hypothetical protein
VDKYTVPGLNKLNSLIWGAKGRNLSHGFRRIDLGETLGENSALLLLEFWFDKHNKVPKVSLLF